MTGTRYARHHALPDFGESGQKQLSRSRVLLIGVGGLGCASAAYLVASGVGELVMADFDSVDTANLQRQILFRTKDVGQDKVQAAARQLEALNPDSRIIPLRERLSGERLQAEAARADIIIDGSDNFPTRFEVNRASVATGTPLVSGAAIRWQGQLMVFDPRQSQSPCYACLFDETAADDDMGDCASNGVLSPLVGVIGSSQAVEAIKLLIGHDSTRAHKLMRYDAGTGDWRSSEMRRDPDCPVCGDKV
jgi:molybdopterin-synthase adenylyltransferase